MREFIIAKKKKLPPKSAFVAPSGKGALGPGAETPIVVLADERVQDRQAQPPRSKSKRARRRERDFIAAYHGRFLGHYHSHRGIPVRTAFALIARELRRLDAQFTPEHLELYRPTKLVVRDRTGAANAPAGGEFEWFSREIRIERTVARIPGPLANATVVGSLADGPLSKAAENP